MDDGEGGGGGNAKKSKKGKKKKKKRKSKKKVQNKTEEELEEERVERTTVFSGDFVRVYHREHRGHVICRVNDEDAFNSVVTPLGLVNRRRGMRKESTHGIYSRKLTAQQPRTTLDFPLTYSSLGVWQILPGETTGAASSSEEPTSFSTIMSTKPVRLRHLVSGQYLALRPVRKGDVAELKKYTSFKVRDIEEKTLAKTEIKGEEGGMDGESVVTSSSCASGAPAHAAESAGEDKFKNPVTLLLTGSTAFDLRFTNASTSNFNVYLIMEYGAATSVKSSEEDSSSRSKGTVEEEADSDDEVVDSERPWRYVTEPQSYGANQILWKINEDDPKAVMKVKESLALTQTFTVKGMINFYFVPSVLFAVGRDD